MTAGNRGTGTTTLQWMTPTQARAAVLKSIGLTLRASAEMRDGEAIRAALWALSGHGGSPVYVTRFLNSARAIIPAALFDRADAPGTDDVGATETDAPEDDRWRPMLENLEQIGDVVSLPGGYWLPTPLRFVPLPMLGRTLVIGGTPAPQFPESLRKDIKHEGLIRAIVSESVPEGVTLPIQSEANWLGTPTGTITDYAEQLLTGVRVQGYDGQQAEGFEFYDPTGEGNTQYHRWTANIAQLKDGMYFARRRMHDRTVNDHWVQVVGRQIREIGTLYLAPGEKRRLLYSLDAKAKTPVSVRKSWMPPRQAAIDPAWEYELRSSVPDPEIRLLTAFGKLHPNTDGTFYPLRWEIAAAHAERIDHALRDLGVQITEGSGTTGLSMKKRIY